MVRQSRSSSRTYRTSNDAPETPLTPYTPRSPHLHRSRLLASTPSRPALKRQHTEDFDTDMGLASAKLAQLPNANPTPSEILSMDLNTLALSGSNHRSMIATPSSRLSDDAIERLNLTLPFARLSSSSSSSSLPQPSSSRVVSRGSLESVHRTPIRESAQEQQQQYSYQYQQQQQQQQQQHYAPSTPVSSKIAYNKDRLATPPNSAMAQQRSGLISPPRSQPIADEENNVFLSRSPRAIRTPRRSLGKAHQLAMTRQSAASEKLTPLSDTIMHTASTTTTTAPHTPEAPSMTMGTLQGDSIYVDPSEDDAVETESVQSSQGGDLEKENHTPKVMECDPSNPFLVMESKRPLPSRTTTSSSHSKNEGCTTPTGPSSGSITRSRRLALGSISPWRWNTFDEHTSLLALANLKGNSSSTKGLGLLDGISCGAYSKADPSVSEWVESTQHHKGHHHHASEAPAVSGNGAAAVATDSASTSSSSSSSSSSAAASSSSSSSMAATAAGGLKSRSGTGSKFTTSSTALFGPPISGKGKLPDHHPNSAEAAAERKAGPSSSIVAKLTENVIQPHSVAFNRRAQQVAGRIYYWKHGSYHLVSDQDKQQWPGEWKFEVFQDPESPGATMSCTGQQGESSSSNGAGGGSSSSSGGFTGSSNSHGLHLGFASSSSPSSSSATTATYHGKGKLTDRQLSGPASKRLRVHREPLAGFNEASSVVASSNPLQQQQQQQHQEQRLDTEVPGITSSSAGATSRASSSLSAGLLAGDRDPRHRYQHSTPSSSTSSSPSSPGRRAATRLRQDGNRSAKQSRLQDRYDFRERRMLNEPLAQRPRRCGA